MSPPTGLDTDLAFLRGCIAEFPAARLHNLSKSTSLATLVASPSEAPNGPSMLDQPPPNLGRTQGTGSGDPAAIRSDQAGGRACGA